MPGTALAEASDKAAQTETQPDALDAAFAEFAALDEPKEEQKPPQQPQQRTKPEAQKTEQTEQKPPQQTEEQRPVKAAELRTAYEKSKATLKERDAELARLKADLQKRSQPVDDPEKKTLQEKVSDYEKRLAQAEERTRLLDYRSSADFQTKYWQPYVKSIAQAVDDLDGVTFESPDGTQRAIDNSTIQWLAGLKPVQADAQARQLFGDNSRLVIDRVDRVRNASREMNAAVEEHNKTAQEQFKQAQQQYIESQRRVSKVWEYDRKAWSDRFPTFFAPREGDEEGNALLSKGEALADAAFSTNGKPPEEMAKIHAECYQKIRAFPRVARDLKKAKARIKELEATLAEYDAAEEIGGTGKGEPTKITKDPYSDAMDELGSLK